MAETLLHQLVRAELPAPALAHQLKEFLNPPGRGGQGLSPVHLDGRIFMTAQAQARAIYAAVLVALVPRAHGIQVLLTRRSAQLTDHPGQISFPGGRTDPADQDACATALREAWEEVGLARSHTRVLGVLPEYFIPTGYRVIPVIGWTEPPFELRPDPLEVAQVFEAPLAWFMDPARHVLQREPESATTPARQFYVIPWENHRIWGATAGILVNLYNALQVGSALESVEPRSATPAGSLVASISSHSVGANGFESEVSAKTP